MMGSKEFALTVDQRNFDEIAYRMISENEIYGLVDFSVNKSPAEVQVRYKNEKYDTLAKYFENEISKAELLNVFQKYFAIVDDMPGFLLDTQQILLDVDNVYIDRETKDLWFIYIPDLDCAGDCSLVDFLRQVILSVRYNPNEDSSYIVKIMNYINARNEFSLEGFSALITELASDVSISSSDDEYGETAVLGSNHAEAYLVREKTKERLPLSKDEFVIGKDAGNVDYCIDDNNAISRMHARLDKMEDVWYVVDINSLNGTYLNGEKLVGNIANQLNDKDVIFLADEVFTYHIAG